VERVAAQELLVKNTTIQYGKQGDLMHHELGVADSEKQQLYKDIVRLQADLKAKTAKIKDLEASLENLVIP